MTASIKALSEQTGASLSSYQVIIDLSSVVKELLENALDAESTVVEVHFKNYGMESVEVSDNGHGILAEDIEQLAQQHATSKIRAFEDLNELSSYGFRGEALHSLCRLSHVQIITATKEQAPCATHVIYDQEANITSKHVVSSHKGTIVRVEQLFHLLPVRRKEFERNYKRDFQKTLSMIQSYAIITTGVKFLVTNRLPNKSKVTYFSTYGNTSVKENIANLMGTQLLPTLMDANFDISVLDLYKINVSGFVTNPAYSEKCTNTRKQYIYVNSHPYTLPQITKAIGDVYKIYNIIQYPFIVLNFIMPSHSYDINVSVDKKTIFLHYEKEIVCGLKASFNTLFQNSLEKIDRNTIFLDQNSSCKNSNKCLEKPLNDTLTSVKNDVFDLKTINTKDIQNVQEKTNINKVCSENIVPLVENRSANNCEEKQNSSKKNVDKSSHVEDFFPEDTNQCCDTNDKRNISISLKRKRLSTSSKEISNNSILNFDNEAKLSVERDAMDNVNEENDKEERTDDSSNHKKNESDLLKKEKYSSKNLTKNTTETPENANIKYLYEYEYGKLSTSIVTSKEEIKKKFSLNFLNKKSHMNIESLDTSDISQEQSENQLSSVLSKKDFFSMKIIGQFNLGFIITSLPSHEKESELELFIIDQHASDEKYNFEKLMLNTVIESQPLVNPYQLNLTAMNEIIVMEHIDILEKNGFKIELDHSKKHGERCKLLSLPQKKGVTFGIEDLEEMILKLQENPQKDIQCSKIKNIYASRACRSSVMIGDALTPNAMSNIVKHMGEMDNPWNCPHGRPTIRMIGKISKI